MSWWPPKISIALPKVFGWADLSFTDRLKLMALLFQAGGGVAMTAFAGYAMVKLAELRAVWPTFYMGFGALILVGIVITGFAGLLIVRTLEVRGPGGFVFKSQDADKAVEALAQVSSTNAAPPPEAKEE